MADWENISERWVVKQKLRCGESLSKQAAISDQGIQLAGLSPTAFTWLYSPVTIDPLFYHSKWWHVRDWRMIQVQAEMTPVACTETWTLQISLFAQVQLKNLKLHFQPECTRSHQDLQQISSSLYVSLIVLVGAYKLHCSVHHWAIAAHVDQ